MSNPIHDVKNSVKDLENNSKKSTASNSAVNYYSFNDFKEDNRYEFPLKIDDDFESQ